MSKDNWWTGESDRYWAIRNGEIRHWCPCEGWGLVDTNHTCKDCGETAPEIVQLAWKLGIDFESLDYQDNERV